MQTVMQFYKMFAVIDPCTNVETKSSLTRHLVMAALAEKWHSHQKDAVGDHFKSSSSILHGRSPWMTRCTFNHSSFLSLLVSFAS